MLIRRLRNRLPLVSDSYRDCFSDIFLKKMKDDLIIYADGGSRGNPGPAASAFVVFDSGSQIHSESKFLGVATNNVAEYNCIIMALSWLFKHQDNFSQKVIFRLDSELVIKQILGEYKVKSPHLAPLHLKAKELKSKISNELVFTSISRSKNFVADRLVNMELDKNAPESK